MVGAVKSLRGYEVVLTSLLFEAWSVPVVTVELSSKWYGILVVWGDRADRAKRGLPVFHGEADAVHIKEVPFPSLQVGSQVSYVDHVPNPLTVRAWAEEQGYHVDEVAFEIMVGRWETEVKGNYG
jgi:hypothetical protein